MKCRRVPPGHWVGVVILLLGLSLSAAGIVSPWWRTQDDVACFRFEGLWQQCHRCWHENTRCSFSERGAGLWRAIQTVQLVSLLSLTIAVLWSVSCADGRRCRHGTCPSPAFPTLTGGVSGLIADLMFVGYIERYVPHAPREHVYAWSFAVAVTGSLLSIIASLIFSISKAICFPKVTSHSAEPYWPYNHCRMGVDTTGYPRYYPYPMDLGIMDCLSSDLDLGMGIGAMERGRQFEQKRQGRVMVHTDIGKAPTDVATLPASHASSSSQMSSGEVGTRSNQDLFARVPQDNDLGSCALQPESHPRSPDNPTMAKGKDRRLLVQGGEQDAAVLAISLDTMLPVDLSTRQAGQGQAQPIFTVEKAFNDSRGT